MGLLSDLKKKHFYKIFFLRQGKWIQLQILVECLLLPLQKREIEREREKERERERDRQMDRERWTDRQTERSVPYNIVILYRVFGIVWYSVPVFCSCHYWRGCGSNGGDSDRVCGGHSGALYAVSPQQLYKSTNKRHVVNHIFINIIYTLSSHCCLIPACGWIMHDLI